MGKYSTQAEIKLYPGPGQAASASGHAMIFRLWTLCRGLTVDGCGWLSRSDVVSALESIGLARTAWNRYVDDPAFPIFFTLDERHNSVYLHSLEFVCRHYGTIPGRPVYIPTKQLYGKQAFRAAIHAAQFDADGRRVGRSTLAAETGVSASSQRRYEKITGVQTEQNYVFAFIDDHNELPIPDSLADRRNDGYVTKLENGDTVILWQTVNRIFDKTRNNAPVGMSRRVARRVRRPVVYGDGERRRKYFVKRLNDKNARGTIAVYAGRVDIHHGAIRGALWQHLQCVRN